MALLVSPAVLVKLQSKHGVAVAEVEECFANRIGRMLYDLRERHRTSPPTLWFIARTDSGRELKVVFVQNGEHIQLKTAYEPSEAELRIYLHYGLAP